MNTAAVAAARCDVDPDCDDGVFCNGAEVCTDGACGQASAVDCADAIDCTTDACIEGEERCVHAPVHSACPSGELCSKLQGCTPGSACTASEECDDGFICNGPETCAGGLCVVTAVDCADTIGCTVDSCDVILDVCLHLPNDQACDDGLACTGTEQCGPSGCTAMDAVICGDADPCTIDTCVEPSGTCSYEAAGTTEICDDLVDNDCDDLADCSDVGCSGFAACAGVICPIVSACLPTEPPIGEAGEGFRPADTGAPTATDALDCPCGFIGYDGTEQIFRWDIAPASQGSGILWFLIGDMVEDLDLFVLGAAADLSCDPAACLGASRLSGTASDVVTVPNDGVETVYIVVDGKGGVSGSYALQVQIMEF